MTAPLSRAQLLSRSAKGGVALLASGSIAGALSGSAAADDIHSLPPPCDSVCPPSCGPRTSASGTEERVFLLRR